MRIKCPHCNGKGFSEINSELNMTCGWCMGQGELDLEIVPTGQTTNEDFFRTATTEELAEALTKVVLNIVSWNNDPRPSEVRNTLKAWLKKPHTNE